MIECKQTVRGVFFFENKLLLQPDIIFNPESNGRNFSSLAHPGGDSPLASKKLFSFLLQNNVTSRFFRFFSRPQTTRKNFTFI